MCLGKTNEEILSIDRRGRRRQKERQTGSKKREEGPEKKIITLIRVVYPEPGVLVFSGSSQGHQGFEYQSDAVFIYHLI